MGQPHNLECIRCGQKYSLDANTRNCECCLETGVSSNLTPCYPDDITPDRNAIPESPASLWRYAEFLPVNRDEAVTLGEGMTPMVHVDGFGHGPIRVKDESRNPTWSFKDRLATVAVSWARKVGAPAIATSSTGNAGAAAAAYAAKAGIPCIVLTYKGAATAVISQMRAYGAMVLTLPNMEDRWTVLSEAVRSHGWFPTSPFMSPAIGSNPIGVEGYKTLAYEIAEQSGWKIPDWCVLPVCYGDALYGMWKGFDEMCRWGWTDSIPRLVAAEVSGSLAAAERKDVEMPPVVSRNSKSIATSIDVSQGTYQARHALKHSDGLAVVLDDEALIEAQYRLAVGSGLFSELSSAAALAAIDVLTRTGEILPDDDVVAVLTASGLKDFGSPGISSLGAPDVDPTLDAVLSALRSSYGFDV